MGSRPPGTGLTEEPDPTERGELLAVGLGKHKDVCRGDQEIKY